MQRYLILSIISVLAALLLATIAYTSKQNTVFNCIEAFISFILMAFQKGI